MATPDRPRSDKEKRILLEKRGINTEGIRRRDLDVERLIKQQKQDRRLEQLGMLDYQTGGLSIQPQVQRGGFTPGGPIESRYLPPKTPTPGMEYAPDPASGLLIKRRRTSQQVAAERGTQPVDWTKNINAPIATLQDALNGQANWADVDIKQRERVLADPNFYKTNQITKYPKWMQQQILADPNFKWGNLPKWQKYYYELSSNPAGMGAAQGALLGLGGGPAGGLVGGLVGGALGWAAGKSGYDPTKEAWQQSNITSSAFGWLNWATEQLEKTVGVGVQAATAALDKDPETRVGDAFTGEAWDAGAITYEALAPAWNKAAQEGRGKLELRDLLWIFPPARLAEIAARTLSNPEAYKGEELFLGAAGPVQLDQSFADQMKEARERIAKGENYREVMMDFQVGVTAQLADMAAQSIGDPLNVMPNVNTRVGQTVAKITGNTVAAEAFRQSNAPLEAARRFKTLVQTGMAKTIDPNFRTDQMGAFGRFIAGINEKGEVRAGPFSKRGLLDKPTKTGWLENMMTLQPESRAQIGAGMFYENIGALLTMFDDPHDAGKYLRALANNDMETWAQLGSQFADSPEFYTVLPALRDFNVSQLEAITAAWDASALNRETLLRVADILGEQPAKMIDDLATRGTKDQDFARIVGKLRESNSPQAKLLLDEIAADRFNADTLAKIVDVFSGEGALPWHPGQWKAQVLDALGAHFDSWAVQHLGLKPDSGVFRLAHLMKSAQSILLLGGSPGYALTNGMSNMVHRAATGIYGYLTPNQINSWMDKFGVNPARLEEGFGMGGAVEDALSNTALRTEKIQLSKRGDGIIRKAHDMVSAVARKMPANRVSAWFEKLEATQGFVIAMRQFWSQSWRRGTGFSTMKPELTAAIREAGINPEHIYSAIEAGLSQADIERALFGRQEGLQARSLINEAAQKIGIAASEAADMLEKTGILDALDGYLKGADNRAKLDLAFRRVAQRAQDEIDLAASRDAVARAEHVGQRVGIEGAKALTDIVLDVEMQGIEKWLEHYERMGQAAEALDLADPSARANLWELKYQESNAEFRRYNAQRGSTYLGIVKAIGLEGNAHARDWLATMADIDSTMDSAYQFMREQRNKHFQKWRDNWDDPRQYEERTAVETRIDKEFRKAMKREQENLRKMGDLFGKQYEQLFGDVAGEAARQAWTKIVAFRREMINRQQAFRDMQRQARDQGVPLEDRQAAAREFWQTTYKNMIVEMARLKQDTIADLDRIARGGPPPEPTPTPPTQPPDPNAPPVQTPDEIAALRQAAEERRQEQRAKINGLWDIAEQYSKDQPNDSSNFKRSNFNDKFVLLASLRKHLNDQTIANLDDAAQRYTPDQIREVFEARKKAKEEARATEVEERIARRPEVIERAKKKVKKVEDTTILQAIRAQGGIDISVKDVRSDIGEGWQPGIFSKTGKERWAIDDMARILANEWNYPINLDDPADPGGVNQLIDMMQRAQRGENIYPTTHDFEAEIAKTEAEYIEKQAAEAEAIEERVTEQVEATRGEQDDTWVSDVIRASEAGDLAQLAELMGTIPEGRRADGETYGDWIARTWDEADQRLQREAQEQAIAENMTRAQVAMEEMQAAAEVAMTRNLLKEKYEQAFPNVNPAEIEAWMEVSDAALSTIGKLTGQTLEEMYLFYRDVLRGPTAPAPGLMQGIQPVNRRMTAPEIENYARALVRAGVDELRRAIQGEPSQADRVAIIDAAYQLNPAMAETVARQTVTLFQEAWHGTPYRFDRFTTEKIGSGEGAQSYGWGLYFAGEKATAEFYRQKLSTHKELEDIQPQLQRLAFQLDAAKVKSYLSTEDMAADQPRIQKLQDEYDRLLMRKARLMTGKELAGQTYKVEIPDDGYLLWDRPLGEQPRVRDAIKRIYDRFPPDPTAIAIDNQTGLYAYKKLAQLLGHDYTHKTFAGEWTSRILDDKAASLALRDEGIGGIKYLDQLSRDKGEGSYNYVIFDDEAVRILETLYQGQMLGQPAKGGVDFIDGRAVIRAFDGGDISTIVHENGHVFLQMMRDAGRRTGNINLLDDLAAFDDWARLDKQGDVWTAVNGNGQHSIKKYGDTYVYRNPSGTSREFYSFDDARYVLEQEMFARGFERYLAEGKAPTPALTRVFEKFKTWLVSIYQAITGSVIDVNLTPEMRAVFDRLLGEQKSTEQILGSGDQRRPAYEALRLTWDTLDDTQRTEAIQMILNRTMVDPLSGLETLVAKDISGGEKPAGWVEATSDLNGLTAINSTWGHPGGDQLIKVIGQIAKAEVSSVGGRAFRVGGDEFSYWFPDQAAAAAAMEAIDLAIQNEVVNIGGEKRIGFSISYGIGETLKDADTALYNDKARRVGLGHRPEVRDQLPPSIRLATEIGKERQSLPTEVIPFDNWESFLPSTRDYAKKLLAARVLKDTDVINAWSDQAELANIIRDKTGRERVEPAPEPAPEPITRIEGEILDLQQQLNQTLNKQERARIRKRIDELESLEEAGATEPPTIPQPEPEIPEIPETSGNFGKVSEEPTPAPLIRIPEDYKPYIRTITGETVDAKRLTDPAYFVEAYESTFARGGTDEALYKILRKTLVPSGQEPSSYLANLYDQSKQSPAPEPTPTPPAEAQLGMFTTEDLPLFSGTAPRATEEVFAPEPEIKQESFIETRPEFGQKLEDNLVKIKTASQALKLYDIFEHNGRRYQLTEIDGDRIVTADLTGAYPMSRVWDREQFAATGQTLADEVLADIVPTEPETPPNIPREKILIDALVDRLDRKEWFEKSRDFETYIKNLGFDLENETDLNLAYDLMEGAYNLQARKIRANLDGRNASTIERLEAMDELERNLTEARRTLGKMKLQQFSTPLTISEAAGIVADVRPGDIVGEPTAGTANLVDRFKDKPGVEVRVNEIDPGRQEVLRQIGYEPTGLNLMGTEWVINNGKKAGPWATVQITNPPWGAYSTGKYGKATHVPVKLNDWSQRFTFLELQRLAEGGRMVGVMPTNWLYTMDRSTRTITYKPSEFYKWLQKNYSVRAVIESPPGAYKNRATDISSLLVVIDKTPHLFDDVQTLEYIGEKQPANWNEYASLLERVPRREEGAITHATEQTRPITAGPEASGIVDPAARRGDARADIEHIGEPPSTSPKRTTGRGRVTDTSEGPGATPAEERSPGDAAQPEEPVRDIGPSVVDEQPAGIPEEPERFAYSDAFQERLIAGRAAVKDSRSFTEYVGRAPLEQSDTIHPHPNTVVETKGLAGVPYPELEEAYRPSPSVMRAMRNRTLSYDGNLDPVWAAIQQNDKNKMGMLVADDVGMGKSRTGAAFVIDRIEKGRKRILVVTKDQQNVLNLMNQEFPQVYSGKADENGAYVGDPEKDFPAKRIFLSGENFPKIKKGEEPIPTFDEPTVYFVTASEFMHFAEQLKQLRADAVVVDEAHLFKNVGNTARGVSWIDIHKDWVSRDVSMLYLTATPGVDLADLQYLYGLKVWTMDGFGDWIKVITGQESPEAMKQKQAAAAQVDEWMTKVEEAREAIDTQPVEIEKPYGETIDGLKIGELSIYKTTEKWLNGRYAYEYKGKGTTFQATNELEAVIVADMVAKKLASMPADYAPSYSDLNNMFYDASNTFVDTFNPPGREVIKSLGQNGITEASDILKQKDKGKWGKKGIGAFDSTLPPAHTEQIMRELKVTGSYMARDISRAGVEFGVKEYTPPAKAKASFNRRVSLYRRIYDAWAKYGRMNEGPKKTAGMFGINGDIQADAKRALFNMRLPGVIEEADAAIARGEQVVISVVSVSEVDGEGGSLVSAIDKINTKKVEKVGKDEYTDPEDIPEAMLEVLELKEELKELEALPSPIDVLRDKYGDNIAFVTGATSTKDRIAAQQSFQANKLDVIVISGAGKTGINLHDRSGKKKIHLIVGDYEWSATNFKQELGRVDRTGQRSSPKVTVMHTGSAGEKKFVATISNRMKGLGATSKGGAESTGTGAMTDTFELGSTVDKIALNAAWQKFPVEWRAAFLDKYFRDPNVSNASKSQLDTNSEALSKFLLGLQSIDLDTANEIVDAYYEARAELLASGTDVDDAAARKTAANTGEILRQVELGDNLRISEVRNVDGQKFAVLDGVLTPHMNAVKNVVTAGRDAAERYLQGGNAWMTWVQFYDEQKNQYVTGLRINPTKVKDLVEHFGQRLGSAHRPETALVDLRAGDRIKIIGSNASEWELYIGKAGARQDKIVVDNAKIKDRDALMKNGAAFNAVGNFFYVPEENLDTFFRRFPINNDEAAPPPTLYQDAPITPNANPELPLGAFEQAASFLPESEVRDEGWSQHMRPLLDAMHETASTRLNNRPLEGAVRDISPEGQDMLRQYMARTQSEMATTKLATMRWGETQRDAAMFNYNRRYGFDKTLDVPYPYQFFYTRAMLKWAGMALDGPSWFSNYARIRMQQERYERDIPERLRGKWKIPAPWMPDWMGDALYIDPLSNLFPPANFTRPLERMQQDKNYQLIEAERILQEWAQDGQASQADVINAARTRTGPVWERAFAEAQQRREAEIGNPMDFFSTMFGPAWYLSTPLNLAGIKVPGISKGDPNKVSNLPLTNTARAMDTVTQGSWAEPIGDIIGLVGKPEEWARERAGLPTLGEYGEYYTKRQLANMVAEGLITSEQASQAMIEQQGELWLQATERVKMELAMRVPTAAAIYAGLHKEDGQAGLNPMGFAQAILPSLFGSGLLPQGELEYRGLKEEWNQVWKEYDAGNTKAVNQFFEKHPEYEAYLAKGKTNEELMRSFLVGQVWDGYMSLGSTNQKQARTQMGELFQQAFLDKETRSYEAIDIETLTQWAQMLKMQTPTAQQGQPINTPPVPEMKLYDKNTTRITDEFFNQRTRYFPNYYELEQEYYNLPRGQRASYLLKNPELKEYWGFRDKWYKTYPDLEPIFRGQVFKRVDTSTWPAGLVDSVTLYAYGAGKLGRGAAKALEQQWILAGRPYGNLDTWLKSQVVPAMLYGEQE